MSDTDHTRAAGGTALAKDARSTLTGAYRISAGALHTESAIGAATRRQLHLFCRTLVESPLFGQLEELTLHTHWSGADVAGTLLTFQAELRRLKKLSVHVPERENQQRLREALGEIVCF